MDVFSGRENGLSYLIKMLRAAAGTPLTFAVLIFTVFFIAAFGGKKTRAVLLVPSLLGCLILLDPWIFPFFIRDTGSAAFRYYKVLVFFPFTVIVSTGLATESFRFVGKKGKTFYIVAVTTLLATCFVLNIKHQPVEDTGTGMDVIRPVAEYMLSVDDGDEITVYCEDPSWMSELRLCDMSFILSPVDEARFIIRDISSRNAPDEEAVVFNRGELLVCVREEVS